MKQKELQELADVWKHRLGLSHWDIVIKFATYDELDQDEGSCTPCSKRLQADIKVLCPKEYYKTQEERPQNIEDTVVHELLHCLFPEVEDAIWVEQAIVRITRALLHDKKDTSS